MTLKCVTKNSIKKKKISKNHETCDTLKIMKLAFNKRIQKSSSKKKKKTIYKKPLLQQEEKEVSVFCKDNDITSPFIFLWNLPNSCTPKELRSFISTVTSPLRVKIVYDYKENKPKYGFASFPMKTDLQPILSGLNERKLKNKVIYVEEGIPQTLTSVSKLSRKRTQSTGLVAKTLYELNDIKSISVQFTPLILFSPQRFVDFITRFLPSHMTIVKVYVSCNVKGLYFFELPTVRDAASIGMSWKNLDIPMKCLSNYLLPSEIIKNLFDKNKTLHLKIKCLSASVEKYALTKIENPSTKNPIPILIQNIHSSVTEQQLFHILKEYDLIRRLKLYQLKAIENDSFPLTKSAVVTYKTLEGSRKAIENLDKKMFCGKQFHVSWSLPKKAMQELSNEVTLLSCPDFTLINRFT